MQNRLPGVISVLFLFLGLRNWTSFSLKRNNKRKTKEKKVNNDRKNDKEEKER